jgi:hypothetical protein
MMEETLLQVLNDLAQARRSVDELEETVREVLDRKHHRRYVRVKFIHSFPGSGQGSANSYTYEDVWRDLEVGDLAERPSGIVRVMAVDVQPQGTHYPLTARYRREAA